MKTNKKRTDDDIFMSVLGNCDQLPESCRKSVRSHVNTIYVGTIVRIYKSNYGPEGQLATAHWSSRNEIYVTLHDDGICAFVDLKHLQWVVDHRMVKPGAFILFAHEGTKDMRDETRRKIINEIRQQNNKILINGTLMDYPTKADRETYNCSLYRLTCNCGSSKRAVIYTCSSSNSQNAGKSYYGCCHKYDNSEESCNFLLGNRK